MNPVRICKKNNAHPLPAALYVHVPFCISKCRYCDFYSRIFDPHEGSRYVAAAITELSQNTSNLSLPLRSVYIGGGTPTALGSELLGKLVSPIRKLTDADTEFTVEANPGTITPILADKLVSSGVNRVNLGAQSFDPEQLRILGRTHGADEIHQGFGILRSAGIGNLSVDLIYGIPTGDLNSWVASLQRAFELQPEHLSCYGLSFEEGTPLQKDLLAGRVTEMDDSLQKDCYYKTIELTEREGLKHYEISNFARRGYQCRGNLTYWRNEPYVGIGPGAVGYIGGVRKTNLPNLHHYLRAISNNQPPPHTSEHLTGRSAMAETIMLGLRLTWGLDLVEFTSRFGQDPLTAFPRSISRYLRQGTLQMTPTHLRLEPHTLFVSNTVLADIFGEA